MRRLLFLILLLCIASPAFARFEPPAPCKNAFSREQEIAEGRKAEAQVYKTMPVLPDSSPVTQYVQQLGEKLAQYAPGYAWPFRFHVVNVADINAFALPGGPVFVNLGTIQAADTEDQLAGVMAHEISHVVMRHATCNETKQRGQSLWWGLAQLGAGILMPGSAGALAQEGVGAIAGLSYLRMSREDEKEADLMGTDILYDAGYDPRGLVQFFEIIQSKYGSGGAQFLSDHPNPGNRTEYVDQEIATLPARDHNIRNTPAFRRIHALVAGMHAYTAKEVSSGAWKGQPQPSQPVSATVNQAPMPGGPASSGSGTFTPDGQWADVSGAGFSLRRPANWQVYNGPGSAITIAPPGGIADSDAGSNAVICGVLIDAFQPQPASDLASATSQLVSSLQQGNPGIAISTAAQAISVNQVPARAVELNNPHGGSGSAPEHDWIVTMFRDDGSIEYLVFVAPAAQFESLRPSFENMLTSFHLQ